jgi:hypothetical protein
MRIARGLGAIVACATLALAPAALAKLKLPAERTSPTGNFFTLEAYDAPTASKPDAEFEMKVCTSAHTPADTAIDPALFALKLSGGATVSDSTVAADHPALLPRAMAKLECVEGWLGFPVPKGRTAATLEYAYNGTISWNVG